MAVVFDAVATTGNSSGSSLTWTHVVGAGTSTILVVGVSRNHNSVSGVTYNGVALTQVRSDGVDGKLTDIWYLLAPTAGSHSVVVTLSASASFAYGGSLSFTGVSQSSPIDAQAGSGTVSAGSTATIAATITTVAANAMIVDCVMTNDAAAGGALTITGGQTSRWNNGIDGGGHGVGGSTLAATTATTYTPSWNDTDTGPSWGYSVISLTPLPLATSIVSYYKLDGNSTDSLGTNNGTDTAITYNGTNGIINSGAGFNGSTSKIVAKSGKIIAGQVNSSFSCWVKNTVGTTGSNPAFYTERGSSGNDIFKIQQIGDGALGLPIGSLCIVYRDDAGTLNNHFLNTTTVVNDGSWHHVVLTKASTAVVFYIDGVSKSSGNVSGTDNFTDATIQSWVGQDQADATAIYTGAIDEIGLWSRTLSATEVTQLYNSGTGLQYPFSTVVASSVKQGMMLGIG